MTLEFRRGEGCEIFADLTAMATPAGGETVYKSPASFATGTEPVPALGHHACRLERRRRPDGALRQPQADEGAGPGGALTLCVIVSP